jgi:hypothetical protein
MAERVSDELVAGLAAWADGAAARGLDPRAFNCGRTIRELSNLASDLLDARRERDELARELEMADIERDRLWCRALTVSLSIEHIQHVTAAFNTFRDEAAKEGR